MVSFSFSKDLYSSFGGHFFSRFIINDMTSLEVSPSSSSSATVVVALLSLPLKLDPVGPAEPEGVLVVLPLGLLELEPDC